LAVKRRMKKEVKSEEEMKRNTNYETDFMD
jgi:hypothetical protein